MWGMLSITKNQMFNYGNKIVEYALLKKFTSPDVSFSVFKKPRKSQISKLEECDYSICSGTTILTVKQSKLIYWSKQLTKPIYTIGSCFWGEASPDLSLVKSLNTEIGVRDSFSKKILEKHSIPHTYIGCPTCFLNLRSTPQKKEYDILFGFSRHEIERQINWLKMKKTKKKILGVVQEKYERRFAKAAGIDFIDISKEANIKNVLDKYGSAEVCVTGRLHVALPVITYGLPVYFFGPRNDTRYSLLDDLHIKVHGYDDLRLLRNIETEAEFLDKTNEKISEFKKSYHNYLERNFPDANLKVNRIA